MGAMCSHPEAERSVVDGFTITSCAAARGALAFGPSDKSVCWPDAKLFEKRPPVAEVKPEAQALAPRIGLIDRIVDYLFFR